MAVLIHSSLSGILCLPSHHGTMAFSTRQITRLEASSNYTKIFFADRYPVLTAKVLKTFERELLPLGFLRTHRRHLVNQSFIREVCGNGTIIMQDCSEAFISKRRKAVVMQQLQLNKPVTD